MSTKKANGAAPRKPGPIERDLNFLRYVISCGRNTLGDVEKMLSAVADKSKPTAFRALAMATAIENLRRAPLQIWIGKIEATLLADALSLLHDDKLIGPYSSDRPLEGIVNQELGRLRSEDPSAFWKAAEEGAAKLDRMQYGAPKKSPNGAAAEAGA